LSSTSSPTSGRSLASTQSGRAGSIRARATSASVARTVASTAELGAPQPPGTSRVPVAITLWLDDQRGRGHDRRRRHSGPELARVDRVAREERDEADGSGDEHLDLTEEAIGLHVGDHTDEMVARAHLRRARLAA